MHADDAGWIFAACQDADVQHVLSTIAAGVDGDRTVRALAIGQSALVASFPDDSGNDGEYHHHPETLKPRRVIRLASHHRKHSKRDDCDPHEGTHGRFLGDDRVSSSDFAPRARRVRRPSRCAA